MAAQSILESGSGLGLGMFMMPLHPPTRSFGDTLRENAEKVLLADQLGFDEMWVGEHYSASTEPIPAPMMFMAALLERTKRIKFATGVVNLPNHHPAIVPCCKRTKSPLAYRGQGRRPGSDFADWPGWQGRTDRGAGDELPRQGRALRGACGQRGRRPISRRLRLAGSGACSATRAAVCCERTKSPPLGVLGGKAGAPARISLVDLEGRETILNSKGGFTAPAGSGIVFDVPGSGGCGPLALPGPVGGTLAKTAF